MSVTVRRPPRALTNYDTAGLGAAFWADAQTVFFTRGGDLWRVSAQGGAPAAVWTTPAAESGITPAADGKRVAFVRSNPAGGADLVVRTLADQKETTIAHDANSIAAVSWSPDGRHVAYAAGAASIRHEQTPDYSGAKIIYTITERTPSQVFVVPATGGKAVAIGTPGGGARWLDAGHVVFDRTAADFKKRTNYVADIVTADHARRARGSSTTSSGASPAMPARACCRLRTASGLRSSAIATGGITST